MIIAEIKKRKLFEILKEKKFKVTKDLSDYISFIETYFNKKIYASQNLIKQIIKIICYLKRQWKILKSKSSGSKYINFDKKLECFCHIRLAEIDFGNKNCENMKELEMKMREIQIKNTTSKKCYLNLQNKI